MHADHRWPGRPVLLADESFASWFARTATTNGLRPGELYRIMQPGEDRNPRDLDRFADDHLIHRLAESTGADPQGLRQATFHRWVGTLFDHDDGIRKLVWLPPAGRLRGKRCFGQQVCPLCLAEKPVPYLRQEWRLSFVTACPVHGRLLLDRCPTCGESLNVLRQNSLKGIHCWSCGADIRAAVVDEPPVDVLSPQQQLLALAAQGWWPLGDHGPVHSIAAFETLALLTRLLTGRGSALALRAFVGARVPELAVPPEQIPRAREGVLLSPRARSVLVPMAFWLMGDWPHRFAEAAAACRLTSRDLLKAPGAQYPFAYAHAVEWKLRTPTGRTAGHGELLAAKRVLLKQGKAGTQRNLVGLVGAKPGILFEIADPANSGKRSWGDGRYWKVDGVSAEVKAGVRIAAHRAGEGVGSWLDSLLRRQLGLPARKMPYSCPTPDIIGPDLIDGCAE